jgi:hypothetical protein
MPKYTMTKIEKISEVSIEVEKVYKEEERLLLSSKEWLAFSKSYNGFHLNGQLKVYHP